MTVWRVVALLAGSVLALAALALLAAGGALVWAHTSQRDGEGFYTTDRARLRVPSFAITSDRIDLDVEPGDARWVDELGDLATVRVRASATAPGARVFIGIGRAPDVDRFLAGVSHHEIVDADFDLGDDTVDAADVEYRVVQGTRAPSIPGAQRLWVVSSSGQGTQTVRWRLREGSWRVVLMNADARRGVDLAASVGVSVRHVVWVAIGLLIGGALLLGGAVALIVLGARRRPAASAAPGGAVAATSAAAGAQPERTVPTRYPVQLEGRLDAELSRWLWLVKWLLLLPHLVVLAFLWLAFGTLFVVALIAILISGRYPRVIFDFNVGVLRWTWRVCFYSYSALGTDRYPPFTLEDVPDYPARLEVEYPERLSRPQALVKWWLLAIPHYLVVAVFVGGWGPYSWGPGLVGLLALIAAVWLLFTGRYPRDIFDFLMGLNRWTYRVLAYATLMRDEYPPFRLDPGATEPPAASPAEPPPTGGATTTAG
jgi:hypothetical protein